MKTKHNKNKTLQHFEGMAFNLTQLCHIKGGCCGSDQGGETKPPPNPPGSNSTNGG